MAEKKKGIGDALIGLFVVREEDEAKGESEAASPAPAGVARTGDDAVVDDLIARYAHAKEGADSARATRPPRGAATATAGATAAGATAAGATITPSPSGGTTAAPVETTPAAAAAATPAVPIPQVDIDADSVLRKAGLSTDERDRVEKALNLLHTLPADTPLALRRQIVGASLQAFSISIDQIVESALLHQGAYVRYGREGEKQTQTLIEQGTARLAELEREAARIQQNMEAQRAQLQGLTFAVSKQKARLQEILEFFGPEAVERVQQTSVKLRSQDERRGGKDL